MIFLRLFMNEFCFEHMIIFAQIFKGVLTKLNFMIIGGQLLGGYLESWI